MPETLLIVDDDNSFTRRLDTLFSHQGYQVLHAEDGEEATKILDRLGDRIGVVIVDLALPKLSGFEVIGAIRRHPSRIALIATSGVFHPQYLQIAKEIGANESVSKPGDDASWVATVRGLLASRDVSA
jgi:two-component system, sensor histidine kinase ChiS